jgi:dienelactone hydrolase
LCHDRDSEPPVDGGHGAAVAHESLVLEAADGTRLRAFAASPKHPAEAGVVVLPDVRGLHRFYETLCLRLADCGHAAVAIDHFGRTAGTGERDDDFPYREHVLALMAGDDAGIPQADVDAWERALQEAGVEHEVVTYPGAPHSFFDRKYEEFAGASQDACAAGTRVPRAVGRAAGLGLEVLLHESEQDPVDPGAVAPVRLPADTLAHPAGALCVA